jgi:hypothetical protein
MRRLPLVGLSWEIERRSEEGMGRTKRLKTMAITERGGFSHLQTTPLEYYMTNIAGGLSKSLEQSIHYGCQRYEMKEGTREKEKVCTLCIRRSQKLGSSMPSILYIEVY